MGNTAVSHELKIRLLGSFQLESGQQYLPVEEWKSKKALSLFKYLIAKYPEKVPRDVLIELLWPESDDFDKASHNLHTTVYFLRKTLEPFLGREGKDIILYSNGLYWFGKKPHCWLDTERFEELYHEGTRLEASDIPEALRRYEEALAIYRGDFLAEDLYDEWAAFRREYYEELYVEISIRASQIIANAYGDYIKAVRICRDALSRTPLREELYQATISYLADAGRYSEAATHYKQCVKMLRDEFDLDVSPETEAIFGRVKNVSSVTEVAATAEEHEPVREGPLVCDAQTFHSIHDFEMRRQERDQEPFAIIKVTDRIGKLNEVQRHTILKHFASLLRKGDVISQWQNRNLAILLPRTGPEGAKVVTKRLAKAIQAMAPGYLSIDYDCVSGSFTNRYMVREG